MSKNNGSPEFDFSNFSWADDVRVSEIALMTRKAQSENDVDGLRAAFAALNEYMAKIVTYVPREWLVTTAPEALDWKDPMSFNYLRAPQMLKLREESEKAKQGN